MRSTLALALAACASSAQTTISNSAVTVVVNADGTLASIAPVGGAAGGVTLRNESFAVTVGGATLTALSCPGSAAPRTPRSAAFLHKCPSGHMVLVNYTLRTDASRYVAKDVVVTAPAGLTAPVVVTSVVPFGNGVSVALAPSARGGGSGDGEGAAAAPPPATVAVQTNAFHEETDIAAFLRFGESGAFVSVTNPFFTVVATGGSGSGGNSPGNSSCKLGVNHVGDDLPGMPMAMATPWECEVACAADKACAGYVFVFPQCEGTRIPGHCFKKRTLAPTKAEGCTCLATKPFHGGGGGPPAPPPPLPPSSATFVAQYAPLVALGAGASYAADTAVLGLTDVGTYKLGPPPNDVVYVTERRAFVDCVGEFLLDGASRENRTVKVNVAWDENDYQIDVGTEAGRTEYKRIIDRNADFGVTHIVYEPRNTLHASRFNSTDGWGWEAGLWLGMGEQLREGRWDPVTDDVPGDILEMAGYASQKGVKLMAYVYPCLHFQALSKYFSGSGVDALDLGQPAVQDWMISRMLAFMAKTGSGGWAWDHNIFTDGASPAQKYAQWRGWMRILAALRSAHPDMVMDHRQTAHIWGPWYQLAGSYLEPIAGDENPETYGVPIASLHTDHVAADNTRIINYKYSVGQLQPSSRIPGFVFHQTERTADNGTNPCFGSSKICYDSNARDFDLLGYKYSLLSTVGTAGQNNVLTMIPARDLAEFQLFPQKDTDFIRGWLAWTDAHLPQLRQTRPIATLGSPQLGGVDGTCAVLDQSGFLFLFNPNMLGLNATLRVDESIGVTKPANPATSAWRVTELYPSNGTVLAERWAWNVSVTVAVGGSDARVLEITLVDTGKEDEAARAAPTVEGVVADAVEYDVDARRVSVVGAAGPFGGVVEAVVRGVPGAAAAVDVNGVECARNSGDGVGGVGVGGGGVSGSRRLVVRFRGDPVRHAMPISDTPVPPGFAGGPFKTAFTVPDAIGQQLRARRAAYPVPWDALDYKATWLVQERLILNVFVETPADSMNISLTVDGAPQRLQPAYNSRGLVRPRCFLGWWWDATSLTGTGRPDEAPKQHTIEVVLPALKPGQFQGLFWGNVETPTTTDVASCEEL